MASSFFGPNLELLPTPSPGHRSLPHWDDRCYPRPSLLTSSASAPALPAPTALPALGSTGSVRQWQALLHSRLAILEPKQLAMLEQSLNNPRMQRNLRNQLLLNNLPLPAGPGATSNRKKLPALPQKDSSRPRPVDSDAEGCGSSASVQGAATPWVSLHAHMQAGSGSALPPALLGLRMRVMDAAPQREVELSLMSPYPTWEKVGRRMAENRPVDFVPQRRVWGSSMHSRPKPLHKLPPSIASESLSPRTSLDTVGKTKDGVRRALQAHLAGHATRAIDHFSRLDRFDAGVISRRDFRLGANALGLQGVAPEHIDELFNCWALMPGWRTSETDTLSLVELAAALKRGGAPKTDEVGRRLCASA